MMLSRWKTAILLFLAFGPSVAVPAEPGKPRLDSYGFPLPDGVKLRLGSLQLRHYLASIAFAADSKTLLSVGESDGIVRFWDVATGKLIRQVSLDAKYRNPFPFKRLILSADGKRVVGSDYKTSVVWEAATGTRQRAIEWEETHIADFTVSADGQTIAALTRRDEETALHVRNTATGETRFRQKKENSLRQFLFSPNGELLAELDEENIFIWAVDNGKKLLHKNTSVNTAAFSPDGKSLAVAIDDKVLLWETASGKEQAVLRKPDTGGCFALRFSADGKILAVGCNAGFVLWDVAARRVLRTVPQRFFNQIAFSPDGKTLALHGMSVIQLWDVGTGKALHPRQDHDDHVNGMAVSADGRTLVSTAWGGSGPLVWDLITGKCQRVLDGQLYAQDITFSADGKTLISAAGFPLSVRLWDAASGKSLRTFELPIAKEDHPRIRHGVAAFRLSADGKRLAVLRDSGFEGIRTGRYLYLWDTGTGKILHSRSLPAGPGQNPWGSNPYFSPDGLSVVVGKGDFRQGYRLTIQETATGVELLKLANELTAPWTFSPDGKLLAIARSVDGFPKKVSLVELATGKEVLFIKIGIFFDHLAFSNDGRMLALTYRNFLSLWDAATGARLLPSPRGKPLGFGVKDEEPPPPTRDGSRVTKLAFLPRGDAVVMGLADGTLLVRDVSQARPKSLIESDAEDKKLESLWGDLAGENAGKAYLAAWKLAAIPAKTLPFLKKNLQPVPIANAKKVERWIVDLGSESLAVRESAAKELSKLGLQVEPALRRAAEEKPTLEVRRRIDALLAEARLGDRGIVRDRAVLRALRAIQVLERIGTTEARGLLQMLAEGAAGARATREAHESLQRLMWRHANKRQTESQKNGSGLVPTKSRNKSGFLFSNSAATVGMG